MVLFHGGVSYVDTKRLNNLGICMSPDVVVRLQRKMGTSSDSKVVVWKKYMEEILPAVSLLDEIVEKQAYQDVIDLTEDVLQTYSNYTPSTFQFCVQLLSEFDISGQESFTSIAVVNDALHHLRTKKLPRFR